MMANGLEARKRSVDEVLSDHGQEKMQRDQTSPDLTAKSKRVRVESNDIEMNLNDQAEGSVPNGAVRSPSSNANLDSPYSTNQMSPVADSQNAQADMALLSIDDLSPRTEQTFNPLEGTNIKLSDDGSTHSIDSNSVKVSVIRNGTAQQTVNDAITQAANKKTRKPSRKNEEQDQPKIMRKDSFATHTPISNGRRMGMSRDQLKYATAMIKQLKKHRDAADFLAPVDIEKYKIYDYKTIIKTPMDLGTVEQKLNNCEYDSVDAFVSDVRLIFSNCYLYNGRESAVSNLAHNLEMAFEKSLKQMPQSHEPAPPPFPAPTVVPSKAVEMTLLKAEPAAKTDISLSKKVKAAKVGSVMQPPPPPPPTIVRRPSEDGRPRREIHPPASKDYPEAPSTKRNPKKNDMQLKFCVQALKELKKTKYSNIAYPFLSPVDPVKLGIPHYPKVIKNPMDISTIEKKLNNAEYNHADEFEADVRLMFRNCYTFNGPESDVYIMGRALEKIFDEKWAEKPAPPSEPEPEPRGSDASDNDDPRDQQIAALERHLAMVSQQLESMKSNKDGKRKKDKESKRSSKSARPSKGQTSAKTPKPSSKAPRPARPSEKKKRPAKNKTNTDCDDGDLPQFTFEQKRELSELINMLNGEQLSNVVQIIQTTVPNLNGGGEEEIELDIDSLDLRTLHKLHQFVRKVVPKRKKPPPKKPRVQYSVEEHDRKILELEMTLQKFENVKPDIGQGTDHDMRPEDDGETSSSGDDSTSSSGSDSEDSDSESDADGPPRKRSSTGSAVPTSFRSPPHRRTPSSPSAKRSRSGSPLFSLSNNVNQQQLSQPTKLAIGASDVTTALPTPGSTFGRYALPRSVSNTSLLLNKSNTLQTNLKRNAGPGKISTNAGFGFGGGLLPGGGRANNEVEKKGSIQVKNHECWAALADGNAGESSDPAKIGSNPASPVQKGADQKVDPLFQQFRTEQKGKEAKQNELQAETKRFAQEELSKRQEQEAEIQRKREEARQKRERDYAESIDIHAQSIMMANFEREMLRDRDQARRYNEERARQARALALNSLGKVGSANGSTLRGLVSRGHVTNGAETAKEEGEAGNNKEEGQPKKKGED